MARKATSNTFEKGLVMDLNPITTPNNVMTSALNVTMVTFNGNEYVLQSDMGNGRVETAYLPAGYVPMGIVEFGGIIYVASYNPLIGKSQIGSFPSPERNISTEEINKSVVELTNSDFGFSSDGAKTFYVQKNMYDDKLTPGDKYIVYTKVGKVSGNSNNLWNCPDGSPNAVNKGGQNVTKAVRLYFATITDEGKIVELSNLKTYSVNGINGKYIIPEISYNGNGKPNLDSYRSVVQSPYNIFNSKVSGKLLLIAELVTIDEFNVSISCSFIGDDSSKEKNVEIYSNISYESEMNVFLYGVSAKIEETGKPVANKSFKWNKTVIENDSNFQSVHDDNRSANAKMHVVENYDYINRPEKSVEYELVPCMSYGPIKYLKRSGIIQLDKIGTGSIELYEWRYYVDNNNIMLNWALQSYPEEGYEVAGVRFIMSCYNREGVIETLSYNVSKKQSYNGSFIENIPFNSSYYKIDDEKMLLRDRLYYVTIEVQYQKTATSPGEDITSRYRYFHRWMYTSNIFNRYYLEGKISDFIEIKPDVELTAKSTLELKRVEEGIVSFVRGTVTKEFIDGDTVENIDSLCAEQYYNKYRIVGNASLEVSNSFGVFSLDTGSSGISVHIGNDTTYIDSIEYKTLSTSDMSLEAEEVLAFKQYDGWTDGEKIELPESENTKELVEDKYGTAIWTNGFDKEYTSGDIEITEDDNILLNTIEHVKAFGRMTPETVSWVGMIKPMADTEEEFYNYNLFYSGTSFRTNFVGSFARIDQEGRGADPRTYVAYVLENNEVIDWKHVNVSNKAKSFIGNSEWFLDRWKMGIGSSIITVVYASRYYGGNNDEGSGWSWNKDKGNVEPVNGWAYPYLETDMYCYIKNKNGKRAISEFTGVMTFMKTSEEGVYVPINMMSRTEHVPTDIKNLAYTRNVGGIAPTGQTFSIPNVHTAIALMLMQLYKYDNNPGSKKMWIPSSAYYVDRMITEFGADMKIDPKFDENTKLYIQVDNDSKIYIDGTMRDSLFGSNHTETKGSSGPNTNDVIEQLDNMDNNILLEMAKKEITSRVSTEHVHEGMRVRDIIINSMQKNYKALVRMNNGIESMSDFEFRNDYCYTVDGLGNVSRVTSDFQITGGDISFDDKTKRFTFKSNDILTSDKGEFSKKLCVKDGMLVLNTSGTGESASMMDSVKIGLRTSPGSSGGNNVNHVAMTGWSSFAPFSKLRFYKKRQ